MKKKILIPLALAALALPLCLSQKPVGLDAQFMGEYLTKEEYLPYGLSVNSQMADEGFVLLKNDGTLPLKKGSRLSVVGKSSIKLAKGGGGSGDAQVSGGVTEVTMKASLQEAGFETNPVTEAFYSSDSKSGSGRKNGNDGWKGNSQVVIGETAIDKVTNEEGLLDSFLDYNDAVIQVITREGSEGCDVKTCNAHDSQSTASSSKKISDKHALELSDNEQALFDLLHEYFDHIIIVINSSNIFECGQFEDDDQVAGVLWIGCVGDVGAGAVGRILCGDVNPSGRTVDTWARDFTKDPTFQNFSDNAQTNLVKIGNDYYYAPQDTMFNSDGTPTRSYGTDKNYTNTASPSWDSARGGKDAKVVAGGINGVRPASYVSYEEGVYVDYRYYETKYDDMAKEDPQAASDWYLGEEGVVYPFGHGLSYTTFSQKIVNNNISECTLEDGNYEVKVTVQVKNTGKKAGKDVVQLYWRAPYTSGDIEKASKVLCAFDKTNLLKPGKSQKITLSFNTQDVANYDFSDANGNGFKGYELDEGEYQVVLGRNAHEEISALSFTVAEGGIQYENDRFTGHKVENRFTNRGFYNSMPEGDLEFTQMSRANFESTFPTHPTIETRTLKEGSRFEEFLTHKFTIAELDAERNFESVPEACYKTKADIQALGWSQASSKTMSDIQFSEMLNTDIDDPSWVAFMNQLTYDELLEYNYGPSEHNTSIDRLGKPKSSDSDGPQKFKTGNGVYWVSSPIIAATYNLDLAKTQGDCIGMESHFAGNTCGWAGPAVNTHRSPFGGRNFEYYSADPFLMGKMAGRVVAGATDRGMYCFFKHFAVNDQEKNRESVVSFVNEQALREIYLKAFQIVIQEGKSTGLMSSYNRLGLMETAASYPLLTEVLRDEWGFKGSIISDMTHSGNSSVDNDCYENINNRVLAGCDQELDNGSGFKSKINCKWDSSKGCPTFTYNGVTYESYSWWYAVRTNAQRVIWMNARSSVNSKNLIQAASDVKLSGVNRGIYEAAVNEEVYIEIKLPKNLKNAEINIDPFTPLPEGFDFDGSVITGSSNVPVNKFIHVLIGEEEELQGVSFELRVYAAPTTTFDMQAKESGCGGSAELTFLSIALLGSLMIGFVLFERKRRVIA